MKAFLLAAGLGTRLKPFTDHHPKALAPVGRRSLLEWNIRNLQRFGIYDIVINVHHFAEQIISTLEQADGFGSRIEISDESEAVLETGGGLKKARPFLEQESSFLVMNVDILSNADIGALIHYHRSSSALATLAVQQRDTSRYFLFNRDKELKGWRNAQSGEEKLPGGKSSETLLPFAFSGIHVMNNTIFDLIQREGKFSLVDVYLDLCMQQQIRGWDHTGDLLLDVGKPESILKAASLFADTGL